MSVEREKTRLALYRKYRPTKLSEVIGQPQVTDILAAMAKQHNFAQSYLFTGQRGTGKTTVARILAHLINETPYNDAVDSSDVDIIEIDAASNNSVDDVREIRDGVRLAPMKSSHKVYIIDEFHMLSKAAFNALLKTIEEPPEYVVFILATTELQKVPATILSRVQRFHFKPVAEPVLVNHLQHIASAEKIEAEPDALHLIARAGGGSVRDSISLLDQLSGSGKITTDKIINTLGLVPSDTLDAILAATINGDAKTIVTSVDEVLDSGVTPEALASELIEYLSKTALDRPEDYRLIDKLLEVRGAAIPSAKLLAVLVLSALPDSSSVSASTTITRPVTRAAAASPATRPTPEVSGAMPRDKGETEPEPMVIRPPKSARKPVASATSTSDDMEHPRELKWDDLVEQVKADDQPSIVSIMNQCDYRYNAKSGELTLYFGKKFFREQARNTIFNNAVAKASNELYGSAPDIVIAESAVPTDSGAAAIINAIGGEVTKVDDDTQ